MVHKTLIGVKLPATGKVYDFWVTDEMTVSTTTQLISEAIQVIEPDFYTATKHSALMYVRTGQIQDPSITIGEIGLSNGELFVLV